MVSCFGGPWQRSIVSADSAGVARRGPPAHIPDNIIKHILIKVPAKYLGRCRCVCRRWKALTSTPEFAELHHNHNRVPRIIFRDYTYKQISGWKNGIARVETISTNSCKSRVRSQYWKGNGLVLLHCLSGIFVFAEDEDGNGGLNPSKLHHFILYNPTTKEKLRIVTDASYIFGIYFNPVRNDYSLLIAQETGMYAQYNVLDLKLRSRVSSPPTEAQTQTRRYTKLVRVVSGGGPNNSHSYLPKNRRLATPVIADGGVLHWLVGNRYGDGAPLGPCCEEFIMAFDPRREEIRVMPHPGAKDQWCKEDPEHDRMHLIQMDDRSTLCLCEYYKYDSFIDIWTSNKIVDGENTREWRRGQRVNVSKFPNNHSKVIKPVAMVYGDLLLAWQARGLFALNLEKAKRKRSVKMSRVWWCNLQVACAYTHNPSIVPLSNCGSDVWVFHH